MLNASAVHVDRPPIETVVVSVPYKPFTGDLGVVVSRRIRALNRPFLFDYSAVGAGQG